MTMTFPPLRRLVAALLALMVLLGSLLLLGPGQVAADHDLTCHQPLPSGGGIDHPHIGLVNAVPTDPLYTLPSPVSSLTSPGDPTGENVERRPRTLQDPIAQDGPTTPVVPLAATPREARSC